MKFKMKLNPAIKELRCTCSSKAMKVGPLCSDRFAKLLSALCEEKTAIH